MIRSTFFGFGTALSAMSVSQKSLDVVGNNIANMNTPGYTRQRLDLYSIAASDGRERYASGNNFAIGQGVDISRVAQLRDPFLDVRFRREAAGVGEADAELAVMEEISSIFDEIQNGKIQNTFADFKSQLQLYAEKTGNAEIEQIVRTSGEALTKMFNQLSKQLNTVREEEESNLQNSVSNLNNILEKISILSQSIKESETFGAPALELRDERNNLIDQMSTYMNIDVAYEQDTSMTPPVENLVIRFIGEPGSGQDKDDRILLDNTTFKTLKAEKDANGKMQYYAVNPNKLVPAVDADGNPLLDDQGNPMVEQAKDALGNLVFQQAKDEHGNLKYEQEVDADGNPVFDVDGNPVYKFEKDEDGNIILGDDGNPKKIPIMEPVMVPKQIPETKLVLFDQGALIGTQRMLNEEGEFQNGANVVRGIGYYEKMLDRVAADFAKTFNDANSYMIDNPDFKPDEPESEDNPKQILKNVPLFAASDGGPITAGNITIADGWKNGEYTITASKEKLPDGVEDEGKGKNTNILHMITLLGTEMNFTTEGINDGSQDFADAHPAAKTLMKGTFEQFLTGIGAKADTDCNTRTSILTSKVTVLSGIEDQRSMISSVSLDEEGMDLLRYQKAYTAAARLATTLDEALDVLINKMGVVGR